MIFFKTKVPCKNLKVLLIALEVCIPLDSEEVDKRGSLQKKDQVLFK